MQVVKHAPQRLPRKPMFQQDEHRKIKPEKIEKLRKMKSYERLVIKLPNLMCTRIPHSYCEREALEYRLDYLRRYNPVTFNSLCTQLLLALQANPSGVEKALADLKQTSILFYEAQ